MANDQDKVQDHELANGNAIEAIAGSALEGVGSSMETIYASLSSVLEKNSQMENVISNMMQQMLTTNIKLVCNLKPAGSGKVIMELSIRNNTQLPLNSVTGLLQLEDSEQYIVDITYEEVTIFTSPRNLQPKSDTIEMIRFDMSRSKTLKRYKGSVKISFPHPLTNIPISIETLFGIYILDQLDKKMIESSKSHANKFDKHSFSVGFIREIMEIHPIKGIELGLCIQLESIKSHKIMMEIIHISEDYDMVEIEFSGEAQEKELATEVLNELKRIQ